MTADVVAGTVLLPVAVLSAREVRHVREIPFAMLPVLFAVHQLIEAVVWAGLGGDVSAPAAHIAARAYLFIALPLLPTYVPLAVLLLEPRGARLRVAPFVVLGLVVSGYLGWVVLTDPVEVVEHPHGLEYPTAVQHGVYWAIGYVVAVIGPALASGYRSIVAFGVLNLVGLSAVAILYANEFDSLWCVFAAATSLLVLLHMLLRRRLPAPHRLQGTPLHCLPPTSAHA